MAGRWRRSEDGGTRAVIGAQTADPNGELDGFRGDGAGVPGSLIATRGVSSSSFEISGPSRRRLDGSISTFEPRAPHRGAREPRWPSTPAPITLTALRRRIRRSASPPPSTCPLRDSNAALVSRVDALFANVSAASAALGVAVEAYEGTTIAAYQLAAAGVTDVRRHRRRPLPPPRPPRSPLLALAPALGALAPAAPAAPAGVAAAGSAPPAHAAALATTPARPAARRPAAVATRRPQPCAADGSDDTCSPFAGASWSSAVRRTTSTCTTRRPTASTCGSGSGRA